MATCSKCGSADVHRAPQTAVEVSVSITWSKTASVDYHICCSCGFVELYIEDKSLLVNIAEKYPKLN